MGGGRRSEPGIAAAEKNEGLGRDRCRRGMVVVGRVVARRMAAVRFSRPAVEVAVAVIVLLDFGGRVALDLAEGERGRVMRRRMSDVRQQRRERQRDGEREA